MTKEELFERWKSEQYKDQSTEEKFEFVEHLHYFPQYFKKAFMAGAEAYQAQWHDLRKNPNDLPPFNIKVNVYHQWGKVEIGKREKYSLAHNGWLWSMCSDRFRYTSDDENVFAWCEIPKFEGAENGTENN